MIGSKYDLEKYFVGCSNDLKHRLIRMYADSPIVKAAIDSCVMSGSSREEAWQRVAVELHAANKSLVKRMIEYVNKHVGPCTVTLDETRSLLSIDRDRNSN